MKTKSIILTVLSLGLLALESRATIVLQDSFSYSDGVITNVSAMLWTNHSGAGDFAIVSGQAKVAGGVSSGATGDIAAYLTNGPYAITGPVAALYAKFTVNVSTLPSAAGTYFAHFKDTGTSNFRGRVYVNTSGAAAGFYRLSIANNSGLTNQIPTDLSPGTTYTIVERYIPNTGVATLWLNPTTETNGGFTAFDTPGPINISTFAMRQSTPQGILFVDDLVIGTSFADVVPGSVNPPSILVQPADTNNFVGNSVFFKTLAGGDQPISYQWYYNTNTLLTDTASIIGSTSNILTLNTLTVGQSGTYSCVTTNVSGTNTTRFAVLVVNTVPIPPTITNQPASTTNFVGETATFTVVAGGSTPLTYQWQVVTNNTTNIINGATTPTLSINNVFPGLSGNQYFVTITNQFGSTNSAKASLTVSPAPTLSVAQFRAKVDGSFAPTNTTAIYTLQGIVTTWADMTGVANTEFYMQDNTGGIAVFWSGANGTTNLPPAGALVRVTGPMAAFNGLLEIQPVFTNALHSVVVLSTNNPLPTPQPLSFDLNVSNNLAAMKAMESCYFVASNVTLNLSAPTFVSGANDFITNNVTHVRAFTNSILNISYTNLAGNSVILFVNAQSGLAGQPKYTGPVTIYGVLGYFTAAGFEFTPSRFADIVPYTTVSNVTSNVKRYGDLLTNSYTENVLRPGETLTSVVNVGDPEGGIVTLSPENTGLPAGAFWDGVTSGPNAKAVFHYTAADAAAGNNYTINLDASSTTGMAQTNTLTIYVPTVTEQGVSITEFLANPTTNPVSAYFNPLHRSTDTLGVNTNDQYIELANVSASTVDTTDWLLQQGGSTVVDFDVFGIPPTISPSDALIIYSGNSTESPNLPTASVRATASAGLRLPATAPGVLVLRNQNGRIVDRVAYAATDIPTNGSLTRFPTINSPLVPQAYVSTNLTTAGLQYDGRSWNQSYKVPTGVNNIAIASANGQTVLSFTANTDLASTLWGADVVTGPYKVIFGRQFTSTAGSFTNASSAPMKFYYISNQ